jgi:hypothetical protein
VIATHVYLYSVIKPDRKPGILPFAVLGQGLTWIFSKNRMESSRLLLPPLFAGTAGFSRTLGIQRIILLSGSSGYQTAFSANSDQTSLGMNSFSNKGPKNYDHFTGQISEKCYGILRLSSIVFNKTKLTQRLAEFILWQDDIWKHPRTA